MADEAANFEQSLAELDRVVRDLEDGQIGLEESLARYEKGIGLLKHCYGMLNKVEQRIRVLTGVDDAGQPLTEPLEPMAETKPRKPPRGTKKTVEEDEDDSELF